MGTSAEKILQAADRLFYQEGIRAVGVDRVISESGVAKATFYRAFPSKDDLIAAWMEMRDANYRSWLQAAVEKLAPDTADRPLAVFDALESRMQQPTFRGCAFINTIVETARADHPGSRAARAHKESVRGLIAGYLKDAGYARHKELSDYFIQLVDGAIVTALREGNARAAKRAKQMAEMALKTLR